MEHMVWLSSALNPSTHTQHMFITPSLGEPASNGGWKINTSVSKFKVEAFTNIDTSFSVMSLISVLMVISVLLSWLCVTAIVIVLKGLGVVLSSPTDLKAWQKKLSWKKVLRATIISLTQSSATVSLSYVVGYLGFSDRTVGKLTKSK